MGYSILPDQNWTSSNTPASWIERRLLSGIVPAAELNATAQPVSETQMTTIGDRARLRVLYGRVRVGAQVLNAVPYGGAALAVQCIWGEGEISGIESVLLNDETPVPSDGHYLGTTSQPVNAVLAYGMAQLGVSYTDTLPGIAYSVLRVPMDAAGMEIAAIVNGKKLFDPRTGLTAWSDNPALALADFLSSTVYGMGLAVDWASVTAVANACDELVSGVKRRRIGLVIDEVKTTQAWLNTLRTHAGCWVVIDGGSAKLVPDRPRATDKTVSHSAGQIASLGKISKRGTSALPNAVEIIYTDTSTIPWREASVLSPTMGLPSGLPPSQVALPGIQNAAQATREAIERICKLWLSDLSIELVLFDDGVAVEVGDVIEVTHPIGLSAKRLRVLNVMNDYGRFRIAATEYDPAVYSDAVAVDPTYPDTRFTSPASPPALTGLILAEELYQLENGNYSSRIRATWSAPTTYPYPHQIEVEVWGGGVLLGSGFTSQSEWASPAVQEMVMYQVRVRIAGGTGAAGTWAYATITALGKYAPPGNVPSISAFEVGGEVRVTIGAAIDKDLKFYELRYDDGSKTTPTYTWAEIWAAAVFVDATPAASGVGGFIASKSVPVGSWRLLVCALDSVDQYSAVPAMATVTITLDANSFLVGNHAYSSPALTGMAEYSLPCDPSRYFVTEDGVAAATKFPALASIYGNVAALYHASMASEFLTEPHDFGTLLAGSWQGEIDSEALSGSKADVIRLSADGSAYTDQASLSAKANARFGKVKSSASGASTLKVTLPDARLRIDAVPRETHGDVTTNATGPTTISLPGPIAAFKGPLNFVPFVQCEWRADNYLTGATPSVDLYTYNVNTHAQMSASGKWSAETV